MLDDLVDDHQPTRRAKTLREERRYDQTQLRLSKTTIVHRDYIAHAFRWGWVSSQVAGKSVLDVGCGQDVPFIRLFNSAHMTGKQFSKYVGVDLNELPELNRQNVELRGEFNFVERHAELGFFDVAICLEVIEHMAKRDGLALLKALHASLIDDGVLYLSTPVFDGLARAQNHIHEYTISELNDCVEWAGFTVEQRFGTFINKLDLRRVASQEHLKIYDELSRYYAGEVLATFLAPLYPNHARNNLWVLRRKPC